VPSDAQSCRRSDFFTPTFPTKLGYQIAVKENEPPGRSTSYTNSYPLEELYSGTKKMTFAGFDNEQRQCADLFAYFRTLSGAIAEGHGGAREFGT